MRQTGVSKSSPLQNAFNRLRGKGIASEPHVCSCCASSVVTSVLAEGWRGCVHFTVDDTLNGQVYAFLDLRVSPPNNFDVQWDVLAELGRGHMHPQLLTDSIVVELGARDVAWMIQLIQEDKDEWNLFVAHHHRLERLFNTFKHESRKRKRASGVIGDAVVSWGLRPGGVLYKRSKRNFDMLKESCCQS